MVRQINSFIKPNRLSFDRFLTSDITGAKEDLMASINLVPSFTQSLVKIASVHMEQGNPDKAFECFDEAIRHNPDDPDIYYHRGQGKITSFNNTSALTSIAESISALYHE